MRAAHVVTLVAASLLVAAPTLAQEGPVDLLSQYDIRIDGAAAADSAGTAVGSVGDMNLDGTPEVIVGASLADNLGELDAGHAYVIFGDPTPGTIDLASMGSSGFRIEGAAAGDGAGVTVAGAGDVDGDGTPDVIVGARHTDNNARSGSGSAYVVFGKASTTTVDLGSLGTDGFRIDGALSGDQAGYSVDGAGDVNNDAYADVVVGAALADNNFREGSGSAYVVFGKDTETAVDLASLQTGFRIDGGSVSDNLGYSVSGAGDVNNDGKDDVIVGAPNTDYHARESSGSGFVVFGKDTTATIDSLTLGAAGFRIQGRSPGDRLGHSVAGGGNFNDDAFADLIVGAPYTDNNGRSDSGSTYVVFGKATTDEADMFFSSGSIRIDGPVSSESVFGGVGHDVAGPGDVNDDGVDDVLLASERSDNHSRTFSGSVFAVFGQTTDGVIDLASLDDDGFRVDGAAANNYMGGSVSGAGDIDDDGKADLLMGAASTDHNDRLNSGSAYIELVADWLPGDCANPRSGTSDDDTLIGGDAGDDISGGDGNDELHGESGNDCLFGENDDDEMFGGNGIDILQGGDGGDSLDGGDGTDDLTGNGGADDLFGGDEDDTLDGNGGADVLEGDGGEDVLDGGAKDDTLKGDEGEDTLEGDDDEDTLEGDDGKDTLEGNSGGDTLKGNQGGDTLKGGGGKDTIKGGGGDDTIKADDGKKDTIDCGSGNDDVDADNKDVLTSC